MPVYPWALVVALAPTSYDTGEVRERGLVRAAEHPGAGGNADSGTCAACLAIVF